MICSFLFIFFFFKQKTAYEIRPCDWSSDVCSSDLAHPSTAFISIRLFLSRNRYAPRSSMVTPTTAPTTIIPWLIGTNPSLTAHFPLFLLSTSVSQNSSLSAAPEMPPLPLIDTCASTALFSVHAGLPEAALPFLARGKLLMYAEFMLDEKDFQRKADATFEDLKRRMLTAGDEHGFDVEGEAGKLEVLFEEPEEAKFVTSPNTPVREIWVSALSTSFKLGWNESRNAFVHEKTGEDLRAVMSRVISQQLGAQVTL